MTHWAADYIGYSAPDCWAFARQVWAERFGLQVPTMPYDPNDPRLVRRAFGEATHHGWERVETPREGDAVMMTKGIRPCHIGVWIEADRRGCLHWVERTGVVFTTRAMLRDLGYGICGYWRHPDMGARA